MKDGTEVTTSSGCGSCGADGGTESSTWLVPISMDELESIGFNQVRIPVG